MEMNDAMDGMAGGFPVALGDTPTHGTMYSTSKPRTRWRMDEEQPQSSYYSADKAFRDGLKKWASTDRNVSESERQNALKEVQRRVKEAMEAEIGSEVDEQRVGVLVENATKAQQLKDYWTQHKESVSLNDWVRRNIGGLFTRRDLIAFRANLRRYFERGDESARERIALLFSHEKVRDWLGRQSTVINGADRDEVVSKAIERATDGDFLRSTWNERGDEADPVIMLRQKLKGARSDYFRRQNAQRAQIEVSMSEGREPTDTQQEGATLLGAWKKLIETNPDAVWKRILQHSDDITAQAFWLKFVEDCSDQLIGRVLCIQREDVNQRINRLLDNPGFQQHLRKLIEGE